MNVNTCTCVEAVYCIYHVLLIILLIRSAMCISQSGLGMLVFRTCPALSTHTQHETQADHWLLYTHCHRQRPRTSL